MSKGEGAWLFLSGSPSADRPFLLFHISALICLVTCLRRGVSANTCWAPFLGKRKQHKTAFTGPPSLSGHYIASSPFKLPTFVHSRTALGGLFVPGRPF